VRTAAGAPLEIRVEPPAPAPVTTSGTAPVTTSAPVTIAQPVTTPSAAPRVKTPARRNAVTGAVPAKRAPDGVPLDNGAPLLEPE